MTNSVINQQDEYQVVVNDEQQYSIWLAHKAMPAGWAIVAIPKNWQRKNKPDINEDGKMSSKQFCLSYIEFIWTDIRPLSVRQAEQQAIASNNNNQAV